MLKHTHIRMYIRIYTYSHKIVRLIVQSHSNSCAFVDYVRHLLESSLPKCSITSPLTRHHHTPVKIFSQNN